VALAVLLCYPAFFLHGSPTTGLHHIPSHVWTSATPYQGKGDVRADVEMRQIWVHGDYMKALELNVFKEALKVQDAIIGPGFVHGVTGEDATSPESALADSLATKTLCTMPLTENAYWGFHSPLMFWGCSWEAMCSDSDILKTIHTLKTSRSFLNITLRPSSVFAGKSFVRDRLVAADALVITLFDRMGFGIGEKWVSRCERLAQEMQSTWSFYPQDGRTTRSQLFEFRFQPLSFRDDVLLTGSYTLMALYVLNSFRNLRAVKSRFGLMITIMSQVSSY
jgi:hypothetical protein